MDAPRPSPEDAPLSPVEVAGRLDPLAGEGPLLVAVSGGPDSLCLLRCVVRWRDSKAEKPVLTAATVDHGLRPESAGEAAKVAEWAASLGVPHAILGWRGDKPRTGLQAAARDARYALLEAHAAAIGARVLLTAHHADDQAETVLMRLLRGSGIHGLSGMPARRLRGPVQSRSGEGSEGLRLLHVRPFLDWPKRRLLATLAAEGVRGLDDPSNRDPRFGRTAMRELLPLLDAHGFGRDRLLMLGQRARRADEALDLAAAQAVAAHANGPEEKLSLDPGLLHQPDEILVRVFVQLMVKDTGEPAAAPPLRLERLESLVAALRAASAQGRGLRRTLGGRVVTLDRHGQVTISPEAARTRGSRRPGA